MKTLTLSPSTCSFRASGDLLLLLLIFFTTTSVAAPSAKDYAVHFRNQLAEKALPYWYDTGVDTNQGGYVLADDGKGNRNPKEKQLVTQARMLWTFAHVHRKGFSDGRHDYLRAAQHGYRFLLDHFRDKEHGGYFWKTDLAGKPTNHRKLLYGEAFVIYAFVEYYRASGNPEALVEAMNLFDVIQSHTYDSQNGGWFEHHTREWKLISKPESGAEVEVPGLKSANAHLHLMEALAELYQATGDANVRKALEESLRINTTHFYPKDAGKSAFHRNPDWSAVTDAKSAGVSYGHNVEFAWLMLRAEQVLARPASWNHFHAHIKHTLRHGFDFEHGGVYDRGFDDQPATRLDKIWWVQAEMLAAFADSFRDNPRSSYSRAMSLLLKFIVNHQVDPADGIWFDTVTPDGKPKNPAKAHSWKANYHDVRAQVKFIETFAPSALKP